jgi:hypothetical protein
MGEAIPGIKLYGDATIQYWNLLYKGRAGTA